MTYHSICVLSSLLFFCFHHRSRLLTALGDADLRLSKIGHTSGELTSLRALMNCIASVQSTLLVPLFEVPKLVLTLLESTCSQTVAPAELQAATLALFGNFVLCLAELPSSSSVKNRNKEEERKGRKAREHKERKEKVKRPEQGPERSNLFSRPVFSFFLSFFFSSFFLLFLFFSSFFSSFFLMISSCLMCFPVSGEFSGGVWEVLSQAGKACKELARWPSCGVDYSDLPCCGGHPAAASHHDHPALATVHQGSRNHGPCSY